MKQQIKSVFGTVLYDSEADTLREAVEEAVKYGAYLRGADLWNANLWGAEGR